MMENIDTDIADSTDWLNTSLPGFAQLENALRCRVCKDFYDTPVITSCSHTFCSLCIRRCLAADGKCPVCRADDQATRLRSNWSLQEVVESFQSLRPRALQVAEQHRPSTPRPSPRGVKRKISETASSDNLQSTIQTRQTRSQTRQSITSPRSARGDESDDAEDRAFKTPETHEDEAASDGLVPCPICSKRMKEEAVFSHLDKCQGPSNSGTVPRSPLHRSSAFDPSAPLKTVSTRPERLAELSYSILKDQSLRNKLKEMGIPSTGSRPLLIRRHTEWVSLWNANCDSRAPKSKASLLKQLDAWERAQSGSSLGASGGVFGNSRANDVMRKDFDTTEWARAQKDSFDGLITTARRRVKSSAHGNGPESSGSEVPAADDDLPPYAKHPEAVTRVVESARRGSVPKVSNVQRRRLPSEVSHDLAGDGQDHSRSSLPELLSPPTVQKTVPMFRVPEEPYRDIEFENFS